MHGFCLVSNAWFRLAHDIEYLKKNGLVVTTMYVHWNRFLHLNPTKIFPLFYASYTQKWTSAFENIRIVFKTNHNKCTFGYMIWKFAQNSNNIDIDILHRKMITKNNFFIFFAAFGLHWFQWMGLDWISVEKYVKKKTFNLNSIVFVGLAKRAFLRHEL